MTVLQDVCFAPLSSTFRAGDGNQCAIQSVWGWYQDDATLVSDELEDNAYLDQIITCAKLVI